jgi:ribosomal protein S27E
MTKSYHTVPDAHGPPCPRCHRTMEVHEHDHIGEKQLRGPWYYSRWYCCVHSDCKTNIVHDARFKVINDPPWWVSDDEESVQMTEQPSPPPVYEVEVQCHQCGHAAIIFHAKDAVPRVRCTECGAAGPASAFLAPHGEREPGSTITLVPLDRSMV